MAASTGTIEQLSGRLFEALRSRTQIAPIRDAADLTLDDAYRISRALLARREREGERVVGKKIGITSKPVMDMFGVDQPDFGFLTNRMIVEGNAPFPASTTLIQPRAEAEIAFILKDDLPAHGVTEADVLAATESVCACFEIVDSRIDKWNIRIVDTVADNASCGVFVLGTERVDPRTLDLPSLHCVVTKNGKHLSEGRGSAVQGNPLTAVRWLANTLGAHGVTLNAGDVILSGSLVPLEPVVAGDVFEARIDGLGSVRIAFS